MSDWTPLTVTCFIYSFLYNTQVTVIYDAFSDFVLFSSPFPLPPHR